MTTSSLLASIVRHRREKRRKCSLSPLVHVPRLAFHAFPGKTPSFDDHLRLCIDGPPLSPTDAGRPLLLLDATWRLVAAMEDRYAHVEPRSLPPLVTVYPRRSKLFEDPPEGLASVEALAAALTILGHDVRDILAAYPLAEPFQRANPALFR